MTASKRCILRLDAALLGMMRSIENRHGSADIGVQASASPNAGGGMQRMGERPMARDRDLRVVLAGAFIGAFIGWAVANGVAIAQENAEVTEDLGQSYLLARRTTSQGSIIETLLFDGQAIVTEIAVPASDADMAAATTGVAAGAAAQARGPNVGRDGESLPPALGPGFGGTLLTGEIVDGYLVLHRIRASGPVAHEIFHNGHKVGLVTEVDSAVGARKSPVRNSFAFESAGDRFVVHLIQSDGTRIRATTEHGRFSGQMVERTAAVAMPPRAVMAAPAGPLVETVRPPIGRTPDLQRFARPQEPADSVVAVGSPPQIIAPTSPEMVPLPRPFPLPRLRPAVVAPPARTASPSPAGIHPAGNHRDALAPADAAPAFGPPAKPRAAVVTDVAARPPIATAVKPVGSTPPTNALPAVRPKPAVAAETGHPSPNAVQKPAMPVAKPTRPLPSEISGQ